MTPIIPESITYSHKAELKDTLKDNLKDTLIDTEIEILSAEKIEELLSW